MEGWRAGWMPALDACALNEQLGQPGTPELSIRHAASRPPADARPLRPVLSPRRARCTPRLHPQQVVVKSQILAGGRGLGKFTSGLQGGVHVCKASEAPKLAAQMLGGMLVTKQVGPVWPSAAEGSARLSGAGVHWLACTAALAGACCWLQQPRGSQAAGPDCRLPCTPSFLPLPTPPPAERAQGQAGQRAIHCAQDAAAAGDVLCAAARPLHRRPRHDWLQRGAGAGLLGGAGVLPGARCSFCWAGRRRTPPGRPRAATACCALRPAPPGRLPACRAARRSRTWRRAIPTRL